MQLHILLMTAKRNRVRMYDTDRRWWFTALSVLVCAGTYPDVLGARIFC